MTEQKDTEVWIIFPHATFSDRYEISNHGKIRNKSRLNVLKTSIINGYETVKLNHIKKTKSFLVHRAVAQAFIPTDDEQMYVNHKDHNKLNNHYSNLEWMTQKQNVNYSLEQGKVTHHARRIIRIGKNDEPDKIYDSVKEAAYDNNVNSSTVGKAVNGINPTAAGYRWKFVEDTSEELDLSEYVDIPDYPKYMISKNGSVISKIRHKTLKPIKNANGYHYVTLCDGKAKAKRNWYVHQLVAQIFLEPIEGKELVNHKNRIKTDNRVENLEFVNNSENMIHSHRTNPNNPKSASEDADGDEERSSVEE